MLSGQYPEDIRGYSLFHLAADIVGLVKALGRFAASPSVTTWAGFSMPSTLGESGWMWYAAWRSLPPNESGISSGLRQDHPNQGDDGRSLPLRYSNLGARTSGLERRRA